MHAIALAVVLAAAVPQEAADAALRLLDAPFAEPLLDTPWAEPQAKPAGQRASSGPSAPLLDFARSEIMPFVGAVMYSGEFEADPSVSGGLLFRVPTPGLLRDLGGFVEVIGARLERDLEPPRENMEGTVLSFAAGADYTFVRGRSTLLMAQVGMIYATFGDIVAVDDGPGLLVGLVAGLHWFRPDTKIWITYNPQFAFDGDDWMIFHNLGVVIGF